MIISSSILSWETFGEFVERLIKGSQPLLIVLFIYFIYQYCSRRTLREQLQENYTFFIFSLISIDFIIRIVHILGGRESATRYYLLEMLAVLFIAAACLNKRWDQRVNFKIKLSMPLVLAIICSVFLVKNLKPRKSRLYIQPIVKIIKQDSNNQKYAVGEGAVRINYYAGLFNKPQEIDHLYCISTATLKEESEKYSAQYTFKEIYRTLNRKGKPIFLYKGIRERRE
jgi:hypothetical protein